MIHAGESGDELFVVIEGTMLAKVPDPYGPMEVKLERGDLVGEIAPFYGERTADVDAITDVTLMRLTTPNLERLRRRHPRIGGQIYCNLTHALAGRIGRSSQRAVFEVVDQRPHPANGPP